MKFDMIDLGLSFGGLETNPLEHKGICAMGSSGSSGDTYDAGYNDRMATIGEAYLEMAQGEYDFWEESYKPLEEAEIAANLEILPSDTDLTISQNEAALSLLPGQTELAQAQIDDSMTALSEAAPVRTEFYDQALNGVDVDSRVSQAAADAAQSFMTATSAMNRDAARAGVDPSSGAYAAASNSNSLDFAKSLADAKTTARTEAEDENFSRLTTAMGVGTQSYEEGS